MKRSFLRYPLLIFTFLLLLGCEGNRNEMAYGSLDDIQYARIAVVTGTTQDAYAKEHFPDADVQRLDLMPDVFLSLKNKKCDVILVDYLTYKINYGEDKSLTVIVPNHFPGSCGVGFPKGDNSLRLKFNKFLKTIRSSGLYDQMRRRWLDSLDTARMPDLSSVKRSGEPIEVGIVGSNPPFDFVLDGKNAGFDIEVMTRFAAEIGRPIEFRIINFGGLIASLSSGVVDAITATITITPERSKQVAFSDPYYEGESCIVVRTENVPKGFTCLDDAAEKTMAVIQGSAQDLFITERYPKANILRIPDNAQLIRTIRSGKCDVGVLSQPEADEAVNLKSDLAILEKNLFPTDQSQTSAIALKSRCDSNILPMLAKSEDGVREKKGFFASVKESFISNIVVEKRYLLILNGLWETVRISFFAILLGTLFGAGICFLRMSRLKVFSGFAKGYIDIMRGTPVLVFLMIVYYVIFAKSDMSATLVAILSFAMNFAAYVSEMFRTSIEGIDRGQKEAGIALGFSPVRTFQYIILPQAVKRVLPVFKGEAISLVKMTSVVGYIAVQDLTKASDIIRSRTFDAFFPLIVITIIYFLLAWLLGKALDLLNK